LTGPAPSVLNSSFKVGCQPTVLLDLVRRQAENRPNQTAYTFLPDGDAREVSVSYSELDQKAAAVGGLLQEIGAYGERVLLLYPPGLDYLAAFFGCLYAGAIAVPAYPPRPNQSLLRLRSIARDANARFALTTGTVLSRIKMDQGIDSEGLGAVRLIDTDCIETGSGYGWRYPAVTGDSLALIQYTSGSTGDPKGVMLSQNNLLCNSAMLAGAFEYTSESICVSWLPVYHDMGLIGGILQPMYGGFPCVLMSPAAFLQRPIRWLEAISRYKATISGGPNFAYDLCARRISPEQRSGLDLSSWSVAFIGSEPIRNDTLDRFTDAFESCGFHREDLFPCYGLAEAALIVSGGPKATAPLVKTVQAGALENNRVVDISSPDSRDARSLVSCGRVLPDQRVVIADPQSMNQCADDEVGEVWVSSGSVAQGYRNRPAQTQETFQAWLSDTGGGPFLRTGDLGFMRDGHLFLTGRLKDLIIVRGLNHYPQDIELTVQASHPSLRPNCCAAFSIEVSGEERLIVVQEVERRFRSEPASVFDAIRASITESHELQVYGITLIKSGSLPKTTSGKIQRHVCRSMYLTGDLKAVAEWRAASQPENELIGVEDAAAPATLREMQAWLASHVAARLGLRVADVDVYQPVAHFGLDSLSVIDLAHALESSLAVRLAPTKFLEKVTIAKLAQEAMAELEAPVSIKPGAVLPRPETYTEHPLSFGQQAMWFLHQLAPESPAYHIATAIRIKSTLDKEALSRSLEALIHRHPSLRTTFGTLRGQPVQRISPPVSFSLTFEDASSWSEDRLSERLCEYSRLPFDLERGPLLRVNLFASRDQEHVLLLVVHHIIADFWSLAILMREIGILYRAEIDGAAALEPLEVAYTDYARWQAEMLSGEPGERLWSYWRQQLGGAPLVLDLPSDRPRPPVQTYQGASHTLRLDAHMYAELKRFSRVRNVTLYVTLVSVVQTLLYRYTSQEDFLLGSLMAGRDLPELRPLVGYFVNPVVLRADFRAGPTFESLLAQTYLCVLGAIKHQAYPFALLVERLQPQRDASRSPLFQVMFMLQKAHLLDEEGLTAFALGESGASMEVSGLLLESVALEQRIAQFDLTVVMAETSGTLGVSLQYDSELFDASKVARLGGHLQVLLEAIVSDSARQILDLPLLTGSEADQLLFDWNNTQQAYDRDLRIHDKFDLQSERSPESVALVFNDEEITYGQLNRRANVIARRLMSLGVGPEVPVGICAERSPELIIGLLGILKAGGAYVPLDPGYPRERTKYVLEDAGVSVLLTQERLRQALPQRQKHVVYLDGYAEEGVANPESNVTSSNPAYVIYTSGSTGKPKGVTVCHRSVVNFLRAMDLSIGCGPEDTLIAVTSISFDISALELFWPLSNGAKVVMLSQEALNGRGARGPQKSNKGMEFSIFYFANEDPQASDDKYRLLIEGARFADRHGFTAVWTPERHFHAFGGLYPNPSVMSAALAVLTERIQIRAGSVVLPLHNVVRVAEEWSLVDNLSKGRVAIAFAAGWHSDDFVFFPEHYAERKQVMLDGIQAVRKLWRGEPIAVRSGSGKEIEVRVFPKPVQPELPIWITAAGSPDTFVKAGEMGANILTHLLGQSVEEVQNKIAAYREALDQSGHGRAGHVTLMLHTFIGENREEVREKVRKPFTGYLRTSIDLIATLIKSMNLPLKLEELTGKEMDDLLDFAFNRYFETSALFGSAADCEPMIERLKKIGVDEVACLIDFGVDADSTLAALPNLSRLKNNSNKPKALADFSFPAQAERCRPSLMQCTPSMMSMLMLDQNAIEPLRSLRMLMLGGEPLPPALVKRLGDKLPCRIVNMYGPTETTIWSSTHQVADVNGKVSIGRPIANTEMYILDQRLRPVPATVAAELCIAGDGLARGYFNKSEITADKFVPNALASRPGARFYKTGDRARYLDDGCIELLGRADHQVKIRGFRIELGEIEVVLAAHPDVKEAVVVAREDEPGDKRLVAYFVANRRASPSQSSLKGFLRNSLPEYMLPAAFEMLDSLPLTPNGKVDRKALPRPNGAPASLIAARVVPRNKIERTIAEVWKEVLKVERVGINDNFFDIGGNSLLMAQAHSRLQEAFKKTLPLIKMLEHPTISSLARYVGDSKNEMLFVEDDRDRALKQRDGLLRQRQAFARKRSETT
jgi:natural product biosynthesis luciferase-like monooxygenase protein